MKTSLRQLAYSAAGVGAALVLWQLAAAAKVAGNALPQATTVFATLAEILGTGSFWSALASTIGIALSALAVSAVAGVVVGLLIGSFGTIRYATLAVLEFLKPVPPIVVLPLAVLVLGPTAEMSLFLVVFGCFLPIVMQTVDGVQGTDPVARDTARSYGMSGAGILFQVVLPSALPYIGTAMRVAAPAALVVTVVAGLLGGGPGLGQSIYQAQAGGDYATLYGLVIVLGVLGLLFQGATRLAERRVLHWHESYREVMP
ncbi:ABC transporter permease subunit [Paenarthrobacter sp. S56]|uniref:ABC transporter permease n=1 Tax=Paenarthrobacter sp. S56 TaxID=3138179 RepID=UPI003219C311